MIITIGILCFGILSCFLYLLLSNSENHKKIKNVIIISVLTVITSICGNLFSSMVYEKIKNKPEKYVLQLYNAPIYNNFYNDKDNGELDNYITTNNTSQIISTDTDNEGLSPQQSTTQNGQEKNDLIDEHPFIIAKESNGKWGFVDQNDDTVIPFIYDFADDFYEGYAAVRLGYSWGFIDTSGDTVIPFKYDGAWSFIDGLAPVFKDGLWGFINKDEDVVIEYQYPNICRIDNKYYDQNDQQIDY